MCVGGCRWWCVNWTRVQKRGRTEGLAWFNCGSRHWEGSCKVTVYHRVSVPCQGSRCPKKSPRNNPEERGSQLHVCGSLKSRTVHVPVCALSSPDIPLFIILDLFQIEVYFPPLPAAENLRDKIWKAVGNICVEVPGECWRKQGAFWCCTPVVQVSFLLNTVFRPFTSSVRKRWGDGWIFRTRSRLFGLR